MTSEPQSLVQYVGRNLAPSMPLQTLADQKPVYNPDKLSVTLMNKYQNLMNRDETVWREHCEQGQMVAQKRLGKLLLVRNVFSGAYMFVKKDGRWEDRKGLGGVVQFYSSKLTAGWQSSKPEIDPVCQSDDDQVEQYIQDVKIVQDYYSQKFFTTDYEYMESLSAQDYGTWVTRFRFCPYVQDIICELLDFPACRWDIRKRAEESSYFIYESRCSNAELEHLLKADIPPDSVDDKFGLRIVEQIAKMGGSTEGTGKRRPYGVWDDVDGENTVTQMWLKPEAYCDIAMDSDEETVSGTVLKKGDLLQMFPDGMCAVGINGMKTIIGLYAENHADQIVTGLYHTQPYSGVGKGISDVVDSSKELDDLYSQMSAYIKGHSMPSWGFNSDVVTEDKVRQIGQGRKAIAIDFSQAPDGMNNVNQAIQHLVPGDPGQSAFALWEKLHDNIQIASQVTNFTNSFPGVDNTTATGAKIGESNAQMLLIPQLLNKASHRCRASKVIFNLFKKYVDKEKFFAAKTKNAITAGKYLTGTQFNDIDVDFVAVANSEKPMNPELQKEGFAQLMQYTGGAMGLMQMAQADPDTTGKVVHLFAPGLKLNIPQQDDIARVCRRRIEQAKKILEVELSNQAIMAAMGMPADNTELPTTVVSRLVPPISPQEKYAEQKASWMADLLDSDELQFAPIELRYVIEEMIKWQLGASILGQAQLQQAQELGNVIAQMPMYVGQNAMTQQNQQLQMQMMQAEQQAQVQQQEATAQQQLQLEGMKAQVAEQQARAAHERDLAKADDGHAKAMEIEQLRQRAAA